jgi:hypothetical protein
LRSHHSHVPSKRRSCVSMRTVINGHPLDPRARLTPKARGSGKARGRLASVASCALFPIKGGKHRGGELYTLAPHPAFVFLLELQCPNLSPASPSLFQCPAPATPYGRRPSAETIRDRGSCCRLVLPSDSGRQGGRHAGAMSCIREVGRGAKLGPRRYRPRMGPS